MPQGYASPYFTDPSIAQGFSNLAAAFAPPSEMERAQMELLRRQSRNAQLENYLVENQLASQENLPSALVSAFTSPGGGFADAANPEDLALALSSLAQAYGPDSVGPLFNAYTAFGGEDLARAGYLSAGNAPDADFAATTARADFLREDEQAHAINSAIAQILAGGDVSSMLADQAHGFNVEMAGINHGYGLENSAAAHDQALELAGLNSELTLARELGVREYDRRNSPPPAPQTVTVYDPVSGGPITIPAAEAVGRVPFDAYLEHQEFLRGPDEDEPNLNGIDNVTWSRAEEAVNAIIGNADLSGEVRNAVIGEIFNRALSGNRPIEIVAREVVNEMTEFEERRGWFSGGNRYVLREGSPITSAIAGEAPRSAQPVPQRASGQQPGWPEIGTTYFDEEAGVTYRYTGGDPADGSSWEAVM